MIVGVLLQSILAFGVIYAAVRMALRDHRLAIKRELERTSSTE